MLHLTKIKLGVPVKLCEKCHISLGMLSQCTVRRNTMSVGVGLGRKLFMDALGRELFTNTRTVRKKPKALPKINKYS